MGTQKTNVSGRAPTVAQPETVKVAGRDLQPLDMRNELYRAMEGMDPKNIDPRSNPMNPPAPPPPAEIKDQVDRAIPEFLEEQETRSEADVIDPDRTKVANLLAQRIVEAKSDGREEAAKELNNLLGQLMGQMEPKRLRTRREAHPALQKLRRNLGLKRIQPTTIEWCGVKWHFAPPPAALDRWVAQMVDEGLGSYSALKLAVAIVGLDDAPLYSVFGVDVRALYEPPDGSEPISVRLYEKRCDACGDIIDVDAKECVTCGSLHDPFDMPLILRVRCAELMNQHFAEEFGPYEDLYLLLAKLRDEMPDRTVAKEQLYPFPELLPTSSSKMDTTPTGAKPSSD